jgi:DNA-binding MarR family transcriptional regulator
LSDDDDRMDTFFTAAGVDMDAHRAVFETIRGGALLIAALEERALRPLGLTHAGYRVLSELWIKGPCQPRQLAAFMLVSRPSIVGTIDTLQANGLVERARSVLDRRLVTVALTPAGTDTVRRADAAWHQAQVRVVNEFSSAEQQMLANLARRLGQAARELKGESDHAAGTSPRGARSS